MNLTEKDLNKPLKPFDPSTFRWFAVTGLVDLGQGYEDPLSVWQSLHADDLSEGEAGQAELLERMRQNYSRKYECEAVWLEVEIREFGPPSAAYRVVE